MRSATTQGKRNNRQKGLRKILHSDEGTARRMFGRVLQAAPPCLRARKGSGLLERQSTVKEGWEEEQGKSNGRKKEETIMKQIEKWLYVNEHTPKKGKVTRRYYAIFQPWNRETSVTWPLGD